MTDQGILAIKRRSVHYQLNDRGLRCVFLLEFQVKGEKSFPNMQPLIKGTVNTMSPEHHLKLLRECNIVAPLTIYSQTKSRIFEKK